VYKPVNQAIVQKLTPLMVIVVYYVNKYVKHVLEIPKMIVVLVILEAS